MLLVPALILIPLSFAAFTLVVAVLELFSIALTIVGLKGTAELIVNGIPEMDEPDNLDPITKASGVK